MTLPRSVEEAWALVRGAPAALESAGLVLEGGRVVWVEPGRASVRLDRAGDPGGDAAHTAAVPALPADVRALLEIFLPLQAEESWVVGQLGQSLDGRIATESGHSHYINGPEDIRRLHGLRALADAVVVGAGTAASDNPHLTTRELSGPDPVRVVLDPRGRLSPDLNVFSDGGPPTLWIQAETGGAGGGSGAEPGAGEGGAAEPAVGAGDAPSGGTTVLRLPADGGGHLAPASIVDALRGRGLRRILVEGGGRTVSTFLEARLLDRLHICVAPLIIGSGRPGITLPVVQTLDRALRPRTRHFALGTDVLFDLELSRDD